MNTRYFVSGLILLGLPLVSSAFEIGRLHSGMSESEVSRVLNQTGRMLRMSSAGPGLAFSIYQSEANEQIPNIIENYSFCNNRLVAITNDIDPDVDAVPQIQELITRYGQPRVTTYRQPWTGPGGGFINQLVLRWKTRDDQISVSMTPEAHNGDGTLRVRRHASLSYFSVAQNPCYTGHR